jgi:hypothetical protein
VKKTYNARDDNDHVCSSIATGCASILEGITVSARAAIRIIVRMAASSPIDPIPLLTQFHHEPLLGFGLAARAATRRPYDR